MSKRSRYELHHSLLGECRDPYTVELARRCGCHCHLKSFYVLISRNLLLAENQNEDMPKSEGSLQRESSEISMSLTLFVKQSF